LRSPEIRLLGSLLLVVGGPPLALVVIAMIHVLESRRRVEAITLFVLATILGSAWLTYAFWHMLVHGPASILSRHH
jgi:hypothetical protein